MANSTQETTDLLAPYRMGPLTLKNRVVMAPMTRSRAKEGNVSGDLAPLYYQQRAGAGLIITEATQVSPQGIGYVHTPGIHGPEQVAGWRKVTDAVHQAGGLIFLQLWHVGRISHASFHGGELPVAPSAIKADGESYTYEGPKPMPVPRALETREIPGIVEDFRRGAAYAKEAGFDGVEVHGANGYLIDQFLQDVSNHRTDEYGGSVENRARFLLEVTRAVIGEWGADRVGVRLSPSGHMGSMGDSNPALIFDYAVKELDQLGLAYLHLMEPFAPQPDNARFIHVVTDHFRPLYSGTLMTNAGYDQTKAEKVIRQGTADLVSFGQLFLANPDLPERFRRNAPLNNPDSNTFYGGGAQGYIDYPTLAETVSA
ncbi:MAG: alkene reductase [Ferruginibacter sp.]|nr:alkene reductase [Cytophagales bacterium]